MFQKGQGRHPTAPSQLAGALQSAIGAAYAGWPSTLITRFWTPWSATAQLQKVLRRRQIAARDSMKKSMRVPVGIDRP